MAERILVTSFTTDQHTRSHDCQQPSDCSHLQDAVARSNDRLQAAKARALGQMGRALKLWAKIGLPAQEVVQSLEKAIKVGQEVEVLTAVSSPTRGPGLDSKRPRRKTTGRKCNAVQRAGSFRPSLP